MGKHKLKEGWTKDRMLQVLLTKNKGTRAMAIGGCSYETNDKNRCAVGCFIPDDRIAEFARHGYSAKALLGQYVSLQEVMPLDVEGMQDLQTVHDVFGDGADSDYARKGAKTVHDAFRMFVEERVA